MALKGTPAQVARMLEVLTHWTTDGVKAVYGGRYEQAEALHPASSARAGGRRCRGFHADAEGYKVDPVTRRRVVGR